MVSRHTARMSVAADLEQWLSLPEANVALEAALRRVMALEGGGSHGRNISFKMLVAVCQRAVEDLPEPLCVVLPEPDEKFVRHAVERALPEVDQAGVQDTEELFVAVQTVLIMLAAATDLLHAAIASREVVVEQRETGRKPGAFPDASYCD